MDSNGMFFRFSAPKNGGGLHENIFKTLIFLVHRGCPPASITQERPNHGQVSVHGEPKFIEGQQPYVQ